MLIPSIPVSPITNNQGYATDEEQQFRQNLIQALQLGASEEGLVAPSQTSDPANNTIAVIQNNKDIQGNFTCQGGTLLYDSTTNTLKVAILVAGVPTFKTVTVT